MYYSFMLQFCPTIYLTILIANAILAEKFIFGAICLFTAFLPLIGCLSIRFNTWIYRICVYIPLVITFVINGANFNLNAIVIIYLAIALLADACYKN